MSGRNVVEAAFESRCIWCDNQIYEGDSIAREQGDGEWMHEACAEEAEAA